MSENEGGYEVFDGGVGLVTIRCRESGQTMTMWADEALGVGRVLAADDLADLTAEVERLQAALRLGEDEAHTVGSLALELETMRRELLEERAEVARVRAERDALVAVLRAQDVEDKASIDDDVWRALELYRALPEHLRNEIEADEPAGGE